MNKNHEACGGEEWRAAIRNWILPFALQEVDLGDDVLELGPGYGATTEVLCESVAKLTAVEIDDELAVMLTARFKDTPTVHIVKGDATALTYPDGRFSGAVSFTMLHHVPTPALQDQLFAEAGRVLRPGAPFVASDSLASPDMETHHEGDTYNPVDPGALAARLEAAGFVAVEVRTNEFGWASVGRKP